MDRHQQSHPEPNPRAAEKRGTSLTRRHRVGGASAKRSTTPTPQRLSFVKPPPPPSSSSSSSSSPPPNSSNSSASATAATAAAAKFSYGKPLADPPSTPLPRPPADNKKSTTTPASSSNSNTSNNHHHHNNNNNSSSSSSDNNSNRDWLADTEAQLRQDLETTKKELELIRTILWEMETEMETTETDETSTSSSSITSSSTSPPPASQQQQQQQKMKRMKMLMAACREYAESRRQVLRERQRQVQFWTGSRDMGRRVPSVVPGDWAVADAEWGRWLSDQAVAVGMQQQPRSLPFSSSSSSAAATAAAAIEGEAAAQWGPLPYILATFSFSAE